MLLTHGEQVLGVHAAACVHSHAHAHKAGHCACLVAGRGLHGVRLSADKSCRRHGGIAHDSCTLSLLDELRILFGEGDRAEGYCDNLESAQLAPLCGEGGVHSGFKLGVVSYYLIGAKLKVGELSKSGLKRADELCLELIVYLFAGIILLDIAADIGIEEHGVVYLIGIYARAADCDIDIKAYLRIDDTERNRVRSAELVVHQFLGVEIIDTLILSGISAVGETLTDGLECLFNAVAERARENRGLRGGIICKLAGLRAELDYLALLDYHHALSVRNGYTRAVCDDVVAALCV